MNKKFEFETFLFLSPNKISISALNVLTNKQIYYQEKKFINNLEDLNFEIIFDFLTINVLEIERDLNNFINEIAIILESNHFFEINLSIKNKNFDIGINKDSLIHLLKEANSQCKETYKDKKVIHMIIDNYIIDKNYYTYLPKNIESSDYSLDIRLICLSNSIIKSLENTLAKFHISISSIVNFDYVKEIFTDKEKNLSIGAKELINGYNQNEVILVKKPRKSLGFFEKFFSFFS